VSVGVWCLGLCMDGCVCRCVVYGSMCRYVGDVWVDVWMDVSLGWCCLVGCMDVCVGRWVVVGCMGGWMCRYVGGVSLMCVWMCRLVGGAWVDVLLDMSVGGGFWVDILTDVSVAGCCLCGCMDGCFGRNVMVGFIYG